MSTIIQQNTAIAQTDDGNVDVREQLFNEGKCSSNWKVISEGDCLVTRLHGILLDLDFCLLKAGSFIPDPTLPAEQIYRDVISKWLERHPVLRAAEVRATGNGLHIIIRPDKPIVFMNEQERARWDAITRILRSILPADPAHHGIAGKTRKLGSVNSKNGAVVTQLKAGTGVPAEQIAVFANEIKEAPFTQLVKVLTGTEQPTCPQCNEQRLLVGPRRGSCYGCRKKYSIADIFDLLMKSKLAAVEEVQDAS